MSIVKSLLAKLVKVVGFPKLLVTAVTMAREGRFGKTVQSVLIVSEGWKTATGVVVFGLGYFFATAPAQGHCPASLDCVQVSSVLYAVGGFLVTVGLADAGVRIDPPKPPEQ